MDEGSAQPLKLSVPNRVEYAEAVRAVVTATASLAGFDQHGREHPANVTSRLFAMLLQPSLEPPEDGVIEVTCAPHEAGMRVVLRDDGPPFDPSQSEQAVAFVHDLLPAGSPDWVLFRNLGRAGKEAEAMLHPPGIDPDVATEWEPAGPGDAPALFVRGDRPGGRLLGAPGGELPAAAASRSRPDGGDVEIGLFRPELATAVSHCIYDAYHLTYFNEAMYRPLQIAELNRTGAMVSAVATAPDGIVAGHFALVFDEGGVVADLATAVTRRAWRGHGLAERLAAFLVDEAQRRKVQGLYCDAVTVHPYTQRLGRGLGFTPCGFRLGMLPAAQQFSGIDRPAQRGCCVELFRELEPRRAPLEVPARHRDMIARVFAWLGTPERIDDVTSSQSSLRAGSETAMTGDGSEWMSWRELVIHRAGADLRERMRRELRDVKARELQVVEARIDLRAPGAAGAVEVLEDLGFFVVGLRPGGSLADWLMFQYFNGVLVDYDGMVLDTDEARELRDIVRANDPDAV